MAPLRGSDSVSIRGFVGDLTYAEVHAATFGTMHGAATITLYAMGDLMLAGAFFAAALVLLGYVRTEKTTDTPGVSRIVAAVPDAITGQIRDEPHYYGGMYVLSVGAGYVAVVVL